MILADYQAISHGLSSIADARALSEQQDLQRALLKRQTERDAADEEQRRALIRIQQQQADDTTADRQDSVAQRREALKRQVDADSWAKDPNNPAVQQTLVHVAQLKAQTDAIATKPQTPLGATVQGIDELSNAMADALTEDQAAKAAAAQNPNDAATQQRAIKAQLKLSALSDAKQTMMQKWRPENEHTIDLELPGPLGDDGLPSGKLRMKVPVSQWNPQHPMWSKFNAPAAAAPVVGSDGIPTLTPQQAQAAKPGTKFRTTDGRILVR